MSCNVESLVHSICGPIQKENLNRLLNTHLCKKINTLFVKIFTLSVSIFWILMLCIVLFKYVFSDLLDIFISRTIFGINENILNS